MHMAFWFGTDLGTFLFPGFVVTSVGGLIGACLTVIAIAITYEAMKTVQIKLHRMTKASLSSDSIQSRQSLSPVERIVPKLPRFSNNRWIGLAQWTLEVLHYSIHTTLGYILMLAVMSYNTYIGISLIIGSTIGYFIFAPALLDFNMSELQQRYRTIPPCSAECADTNETSERTHSPVSVETDQLVSETNVEIHTSQSGES